MPKVSVWTENTDKNYRNYHVCFCRKSQKIITGDAMNFHSKVTLITGSTTGIGEEVAGQLHRH